MTSIISDLHVKFAEKTWSETFQLVRRCMDKPKDESKPCKPLVRSLERLQEAFNVSCMNTMRSRLETIAEQRGMGFHFTDATCYLTADLFYLEVALLPCGVVAEVKVAPHGGSPAPSEAFLQPLRSKQFAEFSAKLAGLYDQYDIPGDNEMKLKLFGSLQSLGKDLQQISNLPRVQTDSDPHVDLINNGRIGRLVAGKEDCPLTLHFFVSLPDDVNSSTPPVAHAAHVTVGDSAVLHDLQTASTLPEPPQLDPQGCPVFLPPGKASYESLPAHFLLKLQPPVPMTPSFIQQLGRTTGVVIPDCGLQSAPLPKLLRTETPDEDDAVFTLQLPGGATHGYVLPGAAWDRPAQRGAMVDSVPFTHPAHIQPLLELLRHQCTINTLLGSVVAAQRARTGPGCDLHFELLPESETSFSVTFQRPDAESLAVLLVNVHDSRQISCTLFGLEDPSTEEFISTVLKRSMSVPVTMRTLYARLQQHAAAAASSPPRPAAAEAENDRGTAVTDDNGDNDATTAASQSSAAEPEDGVSVSAPPAAAKSQLCPEITTSSPSHAAAAAGGFPHWTTNGGRLSEPI